jgi:hypothetical protein
VVQFVVRKEPAFAWPCSTVQFVVRERYCLCCSLLSAWEVLLVCLGLHTLTFITAPQCKLLRLFLVSKIAMPLTCWLPLLLLLPFAGVGVAGEADTDRAHVSYTAEQQAYTIYISSGWLTPSFQHAIWFSADPTPPQATSTTQRLHIYRVLEMEDIYLCMPLLQPL